MYNLEHSGKPKNEFLKFCFNIGVCKLVRSKNFLHLSPTIFKNLEIKYN